VNIKSERIEKMLDKLTQISDFSSYHGAWKLGGFNFLIATHALSIKPPDCVGKRCKAEHY
jgi:hypothetical protein